METYDNIYLQCISQAGAQATAQALTSQQQSVVASYIQQKTAGAQQNFFAKRTPINPQQYYCEVCRISCACAAVSMTSLLCHIYVKGVCNGEFWVIFAESAKYIIADSANGCTF